MGLFDVSYAPGSGLQITGSTAADSVFVGISGKDGTDPNSADPPRVYIVFGSGPVPGAGCVMGSAIPAGKRGQLQTGAKCTIPTPTTAGDIRINATLGDGDDFLGTDNFLLAGVSPASVLDLGAGNDRGTGSITTETMLGGSGNDTLEGRDGNDRFEGGPGNDILAPGPGNNTVLGNDGDDALMPSGSQGTTTGADTFAGGAGSDLASYADRSAPVTVSPSSPDGQAGENDTIQNDVERLVGGSAADALELTLALHHDPGQHRRRRWRRQAHRLDRRSSNVTGGAAARTASTGAGPGPNVLNMREAILEKFSCGAGRDQLDIDLRDPRPSDCEFVTQGAIFEGPNVRIRSSRLRADDDGRVRVKLTCPTALGDMGCAGTLQLTGAQVGRASRLLYLVRARRSVSGQSCRRRDAARVMNRKRTIRAVSIETGEFGDKTTIKPLVVRPPG